MISQIINDRLAIVCSPVPLLRCDELSIMLFGNVSKSLYCFIIFVYKGYLLTLREVDENLPDFIH